MEEDLVLKSIAWLRHAEAGVRLASLPGAPHLTYCTNIHAGESWPDIRASLESHLPEVKREVSPDAPVGRGAQALRHRRRRARPADAAGRAQGLPRPEGLYVFTLNAFPYGPFHGTRVKEEVYQPDWPTPSACASPTSPADIQAELLPDGWKAASAPSPAPSSRARDPERRGAASPSAMLQHCAHLAGWSAGPASGSRWRSSPSPTASWRRSRRRSPSGRSASFSAPAGPFARSPACGEEAVLAPSRRLLRCLPRCRGVRGPGGSLAALAARRHPRDQAAALARPSACPRSTGNTARPAPSLRRRRLPAPDDRAPRRPPDPLPGPRPGPRGGCARPRPGASGGSTATFRSSSTATASFARPRTSCASPGLLPQAPVSDHLEAETYTWDVLPAGA